MWPLSWPCSFLYSVFISSYTRIKPSMKAIITAPKPPGPQLLTPTLGLAFCRYAVPVASVDEQEAVPHCHPLGQQLPPTVGSQVAQPVAQLPVGEVSVAAVPTGTTMVTPEETIVVELVAGQEVVSQFRPVRQHPPA